jgi:hypothetical protein
MTLDISDEALCGFVRAGSFCELFSRGVKGSEVPENQASPFVDACQR